MTVNYRNLTILQAVEKSIHELCRFLDGWGNLDSITFDSFNKELKIRIEPSDKEDNQ